jgi:hypothetical protein
MAAKHGVCSLGDALLSYVEASDVVASKDRTRALPTNNQQELPHLCGSK